MMARGASRVRCSFKQATLLVCGCNLLMAVCISQWLLVRYYVPATELPLLYIRQADGKPSSSSYFLVSFMV